MIENAKRRKAEAEARIEAGKRQQQLDKIEREMREEKSGSQSPQIKVEGQRSRKPTLAASWRMTRKNQEVFTENKEED